MEKTKSDVADETLVRRLAEGDTQALAPLYERHRGVVMTVLRQHHGRAADLDDLCHEVFLTLRDVAHRFRPGASVRSFLVGIAVRKGRKSGFTAWVRERLLGQVPSPTPRLESERSDALLDATRLLSQLPEDLRVVVVLNLVEGWTAEEIAASLGVKTNTVFTRLHRAREKLRQLRGDA